MTCNPYAQILAISLSQIPERVGGAGPGGAVRGPDQRRARRVDGHGLPHEVSRPPVTSCLYCLVRP